MNHLHEILKLIRAYRNLKQGEMAEKLQVSQSFLSEIESGVKSPTLALVQKYADLVKVPVWNIIYIAENFKKPALDELVKLHVDSRAIYSWINEVTKNHA